MTRTTSPAKRKALARLTQAEDGRLTREAREVAASAALAYALLEVAFQISRVADNVPLFGPQEER